MTMLVSVLDDNVCIMYVVCVVHGNVCISS